MKPVNAMLLTALLTVPFFFGLKIDGVAISLGWFIVLGTALWAAIDSTKIQLSRYKSGISHGPVVLIFAVGLLWIIGFPWYLVMRHKIKTGTAILKDGAKVEKSSSMQNIFQLLTWVILSVAMVLLLGFGFLMLFHHPQ